MGYTKRTKEEKQAELTEYTDKLKEGILGVFESDKYIQYMDFLSLFPHYSVGNSMLIMLQRPNATLVQSFTSWKKLDRHVKKGEKGIKIIAPVVYKIPVSSSSSADSNDDDDTTPSDGGSVKVARGFKLTTTFDVSQTEGADLPEYYGEEELTGKVADYQTILKAAISASPVRVSFSNDIQGEAKGYFDPGHDCIVVRKEMSEVQTLKTLLHEMTHAALHSQNALAERKKKTGKVPDRYQKETEAESTAYVICRHFGIDTSGYSFPYVASWNKDKTLKDLKESLSMIQKTAESYIDKIGEVMKED